MWGNSVTFKRKVLGFKIDKVGAARVCISVSASHRTFLYRYRVCLLILINALRHLFVHASRISCENHITKCCVCVCVCVLAADICMCDVQVAGEARIKGGLYTAIVDEVVFAPAQPQPRPSPDIATALRSLTRSRSSRV